MTKKDINPKNQIFESLLVFLKAKQFEYIDSIIEERGIKLDGWDHGLLKAIGGSHRDNKEHLLYLLERGKYKENHPQIALCIYCQCNSPKEVKELLDQGLDPKRSPWQGAESALGFTLLGDSVDALKLLIKDFSQDEIGHALISSSSTIATECTIELAKKLSKPMPKVKDAWQLWANRGLPLKVAQALSKKLLNSDIKTLLSLKDSEHPKILNKVLEKEYKTREIKKELCKGSKSLYV